MTFELKNQSARNQIPDVFVEGNGLEGGFGQGPSPQNTQ